MAWRLVGLAAALVLQVILYKVIYWIPVLGKLLWWCSAAYLLSGLYTTFKGSAVLPPLARRVRHQQRPQGALAEGGRPLSVCSAVPPSVLHHRQLSRPGCRSL